MSEVGRASFRGFACLVPLQQLEQGVHRGWKSLGKARSCKTSYWVSCKSATGCRSSPTSLAEALKGCAELQMLRLLTNERKSHCLAGCPLSRNVQCCWWGGLFLFFFLSLFILAALDLMSIFICFKASLLLAKYSFHQQVLIWGRL